ncbi:MAG: phosphoribosylanthranilate isomerase [bacterium]|nr:phosphoribosylanthranilate isomerase [bacterium]
MVKVKICGVKSLEDVDIVNHTMPDYVGFVFAESKRQISDDHAKRLRKALDPKILSVGVFVNDTISHITSLCKNHVIDLVQLHGEESAEYIMALKGQISVPIIKAVRLQSKSQGAGLLISQADYILFDSYKEGSEYGGTGKQLNQALLPALIRPTFLAGGMNEQNVKQVMEKYQPFCIDVSSSVETDGKKDLRKVERMIKIIRENGGNKCE